MADPYISWDGTVYTDTDIMHPTSEGCSHQGANSCPTCDFDRYYARKHGAVCPWHEEETDE
jgi:nitrite reductase/ring-hydroxylating ferredoxin subunit